MDPLLDSLTAAQRDAVTHVEGPLLILAGPGSGKTRVMTHRIAYLIRQGIPARRILAMTFTNKAADEMRARVEKLAPGQPVWVSTFHRFCSRLLRTYAPQVGLAENFTIYDTYDSAKALKRTIEDLEIDTHHFTPERIASAISSAKNRMITAEQFQPQSSRPLDQVVAEVYPAYQQRLLDSAAVDFDDLLLHIAHLLRTNPEVRATLDDRYEYIMVDEYQDTNLVQYALVRAMSIDHPNLAVTGDPDQAIYSWRGANLGNILEFESDYPEVCVVRLERNYRSTKSILSVADRLITFNKRRKQKDLYTENDEGNPVRSIAYDRETDEAQSIVAKIAEEVREGRRRPRDFAIFYRINALSRTLEEALRDEGIPYQMISGTEFYQRKEIRDVVAYLRLINNPCDDVAFLRIVNTPPRGIGKTTLGHLRDYAGRYGLPLLEAARQSGLIEAITKRAATKIAKFMSMQDRLREFATAPVEEILGHVLEGSTYQEHLKESGSEEDEDRLANIQELLTVARKFDEENPDQGGLEEFLERTSLTNETDDWETETDKVTLMTLHAAKGLEFPVVFIIAVEDGLLPHERSREQPDQLEEERRLLFVGITRAEEELQLSRATVRNFRGVQRHTVPSSFLMELPNSEMEIVEPKASTRPPPGYDWQPTRRPPFAKDVAASGNLAITTAAELAEEKPSPAAGALSPDEYYQGMLVTHPEYSLGKVIALSGDGANRTATVAFATAGQKKFILSKSTLRPAKTGE